MSKNKYRILALIILILSLFIAAKLAPIENGIFTPEHELQE